MPLTPLAPFDDNRADPEPSRHPCFLCNHKAILNEHNLCADCQREADLFTHLTNAFSPQPLYLLTPSLAVYTVTSLTHAPGSYRYHATTLELTDPITCTIEDLFTSPSPLAIVGIKRANDSILRLTHLLEQHLSLP